MVLVDLVILRCTKTIGNAVQGHARCACRCRTRGSSCSCRCCRSGSSRSERSCCCRGEGRCSSRGWCRGGRAGRCRGGSECSRGRGGWRRCWSWADGADECQAAVVIRTVYEPDLRPCSSSYTDGE